MGGGLGKATVLYHPTGSHIYSPCPKELTMDSVCGGDTIKRGNYDYEGRATEDEYVKIPCHNVGQLGTRPKSQQGERGNST